MFSCVAGMGRELPLELAGCLVVWQGWGRDYLQSQQDVQLCGRDGEGTTFRASRMFSCVAGMGRDYLQSQQDVQLCGRDGEGSTFRASRMLSCVAGMGRSYLQSQQDVQLCGRDGEGTTFRASRMFSCVAGMGKGLPLELAGCLVVWQEWEGTTFRASRMFSCVAGMGRGLPLELAGCLVVWQGWGGATFRASRMFSCVAGMGRELPLELAGCLVVWQGWGGGYLQSQQDVQLCGRDGEGATFRASRMFSCVAGMGRGLPLELAGCLVVWQGWGGGYLQSQQDVQLCGRDGEGTTFRASRMFSCVAGMGRDYLQSQQDVQLCGRGGEGTTFRASRMFSCVAGVGKGLPLELAGCLVVWQGWGRDYLQSQQDVQLCGRDGEGATFRASRMFSCVAAMGKGLPLELAGCLVVWQGWGRDYLQSQQDVQLCGSDGEGTTFRASRMFSCVAGVGRGLPLELAGCLDVQQGWGGGYLQSQQDVQLCGRDGEGVTFRASRMFSCVAGMGRDYLQSQQDVQLCGRDGEGATFRASRMFSCVAGMGGLPLELAGCLVVWQGWGRDYLQSQQDVQLCGRDGEGATFRASRMFNCVTRFK